VEGNKTGIEKWRDIRDLLFSYFFLRVWTYDVYFWS